MKLTFIHDNGSELVVCCKLCNPNAELQKPMWSCDGSGNYGVRSHLEFVHPEEFALSLAQSA